MKTHFEKGDEVVVTVNHCYNSYKAGDAWNFHDCIDEIRKLNKQK